MSILRMLKPVDAGGAPPGQQVYTYVNDNTFNWTCPAGVTSVSVVCVGSGTFGYGGSLGYKNNITVVPGNNYTCRVPAGGFATYFISTGTCSANGGDMTPGYTGDGGGNGAYAGGAGGYAGNGGGTGAAGSGGGGGGGTNRDDGGVASRGGGGGVGLLGQGSNGAAGAANGGGGGGGSSGTNGTSANNGNGGNGGSYGGSGGTGDNAYGSTGMGALRIIWPGNLRQFPSTRTADE